MSESKLNYLVKLLNTYRGRDSIIRTMSYLSLYLSNHANGSLSRKLRTVSEELSHYRLLSRLFDDFPMLQYTLRYGMGSKDEHTVARVLGVLKNLLNQIYYPIEHIAWAADEKIVKANSLYFHTIGTILWGLSSYIGIVKSLIMMSVIQRKTHGLKNVVLHEKLVGQQLELLLLACQEAADVVLAVNYLPAGSLLWAGKLKNKEIGLIGTFSSVLRMLMLFRHLKNNNDIVS